MSKVGILSPSHLLVIGATLLAFTLRLYGLGKASLWYDELLQLDIAQGPLDQIWPKLERHAAMPLDHYLAYSWIKLGRQEIYARFPALVFGALAAPLIYALGARLANKRVGVIAAWLLTLASFAIRYSQEARPYALLMALTMIGYLWVWRAYQTGRRRYWGLVVIGFLGAALSHYFALFLLLPAGLFVAFQQLYRSKEKIVREHSACFGLLLAILLTLFIGLGRTDKLYGVGRRFVQDLSQPSALTRPAAEKPNRGSGPPLEKIYVISKVFAPLGADKDFPLLLYNLFFTIALLSLARPWARGRAAILLLLAWGVLPIILIYLFLVARGTFFAMRYILYTLPAYLLLVAWGVDLVATYLQNRLTFLSSPGLPDLVGQVDNLPYDILSGQPGSRPVTGTSPKGVQPSPTAVGQLKRSILLMTLPGLLLMPLFQAEAGELRAYYTAPAYEDWRAVGQLLQANAWPNDVVIAVRAEPALNWYYPPANAPLDTFTGSDPIWEAMAQHSRRWFVLSSYSFKRDQGLRDWLSQQGAVIIAIDQRLVVYFHQEGLSHLDHLAQAQTFSLPPNPLTYARLGDQFFEAGNLETAQTFYQRAIQLGPLAGKEGQTAYQARLARIQAKSSPCHLVLTNRFVQSSGSRK